jgi:hypothetical protein
MPEKRWLLGLGPPVLVIGAIALIGPSAWVTAAAQRAELNPEATPGELRRLAPDVSSRAWIAERGDGTWVYGRAGVGILRDLPAGETAIAIGRTYVASTKPRADGVSHLRLREWRTGVLTVELEAPIWISTGAFRDDDLVVTGYGDASATSDGGLAVVGAGSNQLEALVPAAPFPADLGPSAARGDVHVSPNGRLAASYLCSGETCATQVVDLETRRLVHNGRQKGFLRAITDSTMILTDDEHAWISASDIRTGRELWRIPDSILMNPLAGADGSVTGLIGSNGPGWAVGRIGPDGVATDLTPRTWNGAWPQVWTQVSTGGSAVIGHGDFAAALSGHVAPTADVIDIARQRVLGRDIPLLPAP